MANPKILALAGSLRRDSFNKKLIRIAAEGARAAGAEVTLVDLADFRMPVYDGDLEDAEGIPDAARKLKQVFKAHQGLLISSPEYNSSLSGTLKNVIDWLSRPEPNEPPLVAFAGKTAGLMSCSPGALGGLRGLVHLRAILSNIQVLVIPDQIAVSAANDAFDDSGRLRDAKKLDQVKAVAARLALLTAKLAT